MSTIIIIDDDRALCRSLQIQLSEHGHQVEFACSAKDGLELVPRTQPDLILLDLGLPDATGLGVLPKLARMTQSPVAIITGQQDMNTTIDAMRHGAFDYLRKPFEMDDLLLMLEKAHRLQRSSSKRQNDVSVSAKLVTENRHEIVGSDPKMVEILKQIGLLSLSQVTVLIEGDSGTGKEAIARAIHNAATPEEPFVPINCSAVVANLLESELFGYEKGAFTGADNRKIGKMELAEDGTLFLDEIGDMSMSLQAKLLRVLQEREFERVGGLKPIPFKARVIAATHRDLQRWVEEKKFREDLHFRLAVSRIEIPPLRERRRDIRPIVGHLLARISKDLKRTVTGVDEAALKKLEMHDWPGNVRELQNVLTRAIALSQGEILQPEDLEIMAASGQVQDASKEEILPLRDAESRHIEKALIAHGWNITRTAETLQISPTTLRKKIGDYSLRA